MGSRRGSREYANLNAPASGARKFSDARRRTELMFGPSCRNPPLRKLLERECVR